MATSKYSPLDQSFRYLLHHIGIELNAKNCRSLRFLYEMGNESTNGEEPGLDILQELHSQTYFTSLNPDRLQNDLTRIKRQDLANLVEQYKKSSEYKKEVKQQGEGKTRKGTKGHSEEEGKVKKGTKGRRSDDLTYLEIVVTNQKHGQKATAEERCRHILSITFMHILHSIDQSRCLVEAVLKESEELAKKKEVTASISDIKKDFERISVSLKKVISVTKEMNALATEVVEYSVEGQHGLH